MQNNLGLAQRWMLWIKRIWIKEAFAIFKCLIPYSCCSHVTLISFSPKENFFKHLFKIQTSNDATWKRRKKKTHIWFPTPVHELREVIKQSSNIALSVSHKTMKWKSVTASTRCYPESKHAKCRKKSFFLWILSFFSAKSFFSFFFLQLNYCIWRPQIGALVMKCRHNTYMTTCIHTNTDREGEYKMQTESCTEIFSISKAMNPSNRAANLLERSSLAWYPRQNQADIT